VGFDCAKESSTDAGAAEVAAIVSAKISVTLISIIMLRLLMPDSASQTRSRYVAFISALAFEGARSKQASVWVRVAYIGVNSRRNRSAVLRLSSSRRSIHQHHRVVIMEAAAISRVRV
jgi:hypothetical protein